jgi:hypothetical protein
MRYVKICGVTLALLIIVSGFAFVTNTIATEEGNAKINSAQVNQETAPGQPATSNVPYTGLLRTVLYEDHTNSRCVPCVAVEAASVPVLDYYYNDSLVAPLYPHMWWPAGNDSIWLYSSADAFARNQYYGSFNGVPHIRNDGVKIRHHSSSAEVYYSYWNYALGQLSRFSITTIGNLTTETVSAMVEAHEVIEPNPNRMIRFGFWETDIDVIPRFGWKGQKFNTYHWAMWDMLPDAAGEPVFPAGANPGDKAWFNRTFFIDPGQGMIPENLGVTVFIQDDNTQRVVQAAVENFKPADPPPAHELATYGLECDGDPLHTYEGPHDYLKSGKTVQVNGTVCNYGDSVETNIQVDLLIEGVVEQTQYITSLDPGYGEMVTFDWTTPTVAGFYDVGVRCELIPGETNTTNNIHEKLCEVRLTPAITYDPAAFNFDVLEGDVGFDNLTMGNVGVAALDHDTYIGATADIVGDWDYGTLYISNFDCGNIYSVTTPTTLNEIKMYLRFTGSRQLYYLVYQSPTLTGTYNKIHETNITDTGTGERWYSSGPISVPLVAGTYYMVILKYVGTVEWGFQEIANDPVPIPVSFGMLETGTYQNYLGVPPEATVNIIRTNRAAIHQALITEDGSGDWLGVSPTAGTIPPATQDDIMLTADASSLAPGNYHTQMVVWNNDPDCWAVHIPVNMNVVQLTIWADATGPVGSGGPNINITYITGGSPMSASLWYSDDGGMSWTPAGIDSPADGIFPWILPGYGTYWWGAFAPGGDDDGGAGEMWPEAGPYVYAIPTFDIPLPNGAGWNFISFPIDISGDPVTLLDDSAGDGLTTWNHIRWFDVTDAVDPWKSFTTFRPVNDVFDLNNTMGVWIYIVNPGDGVLTVSGSDDGSTAIDLRVGWNMVGYPANVDSAYDVDALIADTGATEVMGFNPAMPYHIEPLAGGYILKRGEAYWVHVNADTSWVVDW